MRTGKTMHELAAEISRQAETKRDFLAPTNKLEMQLADNRPIFHIDGLNEQFGIQSLAHEHVAKQTGIRKDYYDRMLTEAPDLLTQNVNYWFQKNPEARMTRTLDGNVRAMLSPRYRVLDNYDLFVAIASEAIAMQSTGLQLVSSEITEKRFYMKFVYPRLEAEIKVGDKVQAGVIVSNSEIGFGRIQVSPYTLRLLCSNGMIAEDRAMRKTHVGRALTELEEAYELFTDETKQLENRAFFAKVKDTFKAALNEDIFFSHVDDLKGSTTRQITGNVEGAVEQIANRFTFNESERSAVMNHLFREQDLTQYGLAQAITRTAEDVDSYDRATQFEKFGGEVITLNPSEWKVIAEADKPEERKRRGRKPRNPIGVAV